MKNYFFLIALLFSGVSVSAQGTWFDLGVNFAYGPTVLANNNLFNTSSVDYLITSGTKYGLKLGVNSGESSGAHLVYNYGNSRQDFEFDTPLAIDNPMSFEWTTHELMLLYRYSGRGAYLEVGPGYSILNSIEQSIENSELVDIGDFYQDYFSGVLGFGAYIAGSDALTVNLGLRLQYAFTNIVNEDGQDLNIPEATFGLSDQETASTNPLSAQINLEVVYAFGRLAKQTCSGRNKLILFQ